MSEFKPYWVDGLSNEAYHADKEFQSSSTIKLMSKSPLDYIDTVRNGSAVIQSDAMNMSTLCHHIILEGEDFIKRYQVKPKFDCRYNEQKAAKAIWEEEHKHKVAVTEDEIHELEGIYEGFMRNEEAMAILKDSLFERSGYYLDPETRQKLRIRYDSFDPKLGLLADLKAVRDVTYKKFVDQIISYRWDFSMAMYGEGIREIDGCGVYDYAFIAIMKTRPYHCVVYPIEDAVIERAKREYRRNLDKIAECHKTNVWPGLEDNMKMIELPKWFMEKEIT